MRTKDMILAVAIALGMMFALLICIHIVWYITFQLFGKALVYLVLGLLLFAGSYIVAFIIQERTR